MNHGIITRAGLMLVAGALMATSGRLSAQSTQDAVSREVSAFNYGSLTAPSAGMEAVSREVSAFNYGSLAVPSPVIEAVSREVSAFNYGSLSVPSGNNEALSREVSVFNFGGLDVPSMNTEASSREVSVFNYGSLAVPSTGTEAMSREVSVFNYGLLSVPSVNTEAMSREVSVFNYGELNYASAGSEAISREVSVINYGNPPILFSIGSTNALGDVPSRVPLTLQTYLDLTNVSFTLRTEDSHLQMLGVAPASAEVYSAALETLELNTHSISLDINPAALPITNHTLAYLNFEGLTNLNSAVVPLLISKLTGWRVNGQTAPGIAKDGSVILIVTRPILFPTHEPSFGFVMYGVPNTAYSIQATTNLEPPAWIEVQNILETDNWISVSGLTNRGPQQFYRAQQVGP